MLSFKLIIDEMFEHWQQLAYFDNQDSVFPSDELLDQLEIYEGSTRKYVSAVLANLASDFNSTLLELGAYDWFCYQGYRRVLVHNEAAIFF